MLGHAIEHGVHTRDVILGDRSWNMADLARCSITVIVGAQDRQPGRQCRAGEFHDPRGNRAGVGEQDSGEFDAAAGRQRAGQNHVVPVTGGDHQHPWTQSRDHFGDGPRGGHELGDAAGIEFAPPDQVGMQVLCDVQGPRCAQDGVFRNHAPDADLSELVLGQHRVETLGSLVEDDPGHAAILVCELTGRQA